MNVDVTAAQYKILLDAVALGSFSTIEEALNKALQMLQKWNDFIESLNLASAELHAGLGGPAEEVFEFLERRIDEIERERRRAE